MNLPVETLADPLVAHARAMLAHLGENPHRPGLAETPKRFASAMRFLTGGYEAEPEDVVGGGVFEAEGADFPRSRASSTSMRAACRCRSASPSRSPTRW